jgi:hypothetical protein
LKLLSITDEFAREALTMEVGRHGRDTNARALFAPKGDP